MTEEDIGFEPEGLPEHPPIKFHQTKDFAGPGEMMPAKRNVRQTLCIKQFGFKLLLPASKQNLMAPCLHNPAKMLEKVYMPGMPDVNKNMHNQSKGG